MTDDVREKARELASDRADWLVDAIATSTQDRRFLRGDPDEDKVATESILVNAQKAISVAIDKALSSARNAALEEAAGVADVANKRLTDGYHADGAAVVGALARSIRALKDKE